MTDATTNPFDSSSILDGIRRWVEIETPTEVPVQVNKLADLVASGYRDLPATVERLSLIHISEPTDRTRSRMPSSA